MRIAVYAVALVAGLGVMFEPTLASGLTRWQADPGDTVLNAYLLEHTWRAVGDAGYRHSLLSPPFYSPAPCVLGYSETLLGTAPLYWALRLGLPAEQAYPVWMIVLAALNFIAFAVVGRWLKLHDVLNLLGAWLFAFGVCHTYSLMHQQLLCRCWMPFALYWLIRFVTTLQARDLRNSFVFLALQMAACINSGVMFGIGLVFFGVIAISVRPRGWHDAWQALKHDWRGFAVAFGIGGTLWILSVSPVIYANAADGRVRGYAETLEFMPVASSWLTPPLHWRWESLAFLRKYTNDECYLFCGLGPLVLLSFAFIPYCCQRTEQTRLAFACGLTAVLLALSIVNYGEGVSPWWFVRYLPGGLAVRAIGRAFIAVYLFAALGGLFGLASVISNHRQMFLVILLAGVMVFEQLGYEPQSFDVAEAERNVGPIAELMTGADVAYVHSGDEADWHVYTSLLAMRAGHRANVPVINGYSGRAPKGYPFEAHWSDDDLRTWLGPGFHGRVAVIEPKTKTRRWLIIP